MTHDPVCPTSVHSGVECYCFIITATRIDERKALAEEIDRFTDVFGTIATPILRSVAQSMRKGERLI